MERGSDKGMREEERTNLCQAHGDGPLSGPHSQRAHREKYFQIFYVDETDFRVRARHPKI
jgi:hypothetical protein